MKTQSMNSKSFLFPAILWLGAFICALSPVNEWQVQFLIGTIVLVFAWAYTMLSRDIETGWPVPSTPVLILGGAFWLLVVVSAFWSEVKPVSLTGVCLFSIMPLTLFAGIMGGNNAYFKKIAVPLAVIFAVLALWAVFQFFLLNNYFQGQARHPLADPSSLGALFSLGLFCALGWVVADRPKREHGIAVVLAVLLTWGMMATVARGPVFAFIPGIVFFLILLWPQVKAKWKSLLLVAVSALVFYGLMRSGIQDAYDLGERLFGTFSGAAAEGSNNRLDIWASAIDIIKKHPLTGTGIGTFFLYYPEVRRLTETDGVFMAHNDPLQFWAELGVLGPLLFYAFAAAAAMRTFSALKSAVSNDRIIIVSVFAALVAMVVHSHVSFNHYSLSILLLTGLLLSVWFLATGRALNEAANLTVMPENMPQGLNRVFLILPFIAIGWLYLSIMAGEYFANRARDNLFKEQMMCAQGAQNCFVENVNRANRVSMGLNSRIYLFAVNVPIAILNEGKKSPEQQKELYEQTVRYMDAVLGINPRAASAYYYLGLVQELVDADIVPKDTKTPEEYYLEALRLDPMHVGARMGLYNLYKKQGRPLKELIALMEPGANFSYTTPMAENYLSEIAKLYLENKDYGKMQKALLKLAAFKERSEYSQKRQDTTIPQAIMGGDEMLMTK